MSTKATAQRGDHAAAHLARAGNEATPAFRATGLRVATTITHRELRLAGRDDVSEEDDAQPPPLMACHRDEDAPLLRT